MPVYHQRMVAAPPALTLTPRPPFDAAPILRYLSRSPLEPLDVVTDGCYRRAVRLDGWPSLIEVAPEGSTAAPRVTVRLLGPDADPARLVLAGQEVARWWRLDQDPSTLAEIAGRDPVLAALFARLHGARAPLMPSPFECLIWAILGQQITLAFAYKMKRALVERYGDALTHEGRTYRLFPEASRLAEADPADLREIQFSRQKSDYVRSLASLEADGQIAWAEIAALPTEEAIAALTTLRGVGRWTAEYILMRGLGHPDVIPAADIGLRSAIGRAYGFGRNATEAEVRVLAEGWVPHRSYAAFAWWWSLADARLPA
jgi:DNA-3-methyladenine glycosylase II